MKSLNGENKMAKSDPAKDKDPDDSLKQQLEEAVKLAEQAVKEQQEKNEKGGGSSKK
jgi:cation transport regulator ChaB